jgi:hypothetical protein
MGWGFRRSKSLGLFRLNFSKSGVGFSFGVPGARVGVNSKGKKYVRGGVPGTGLYYQQTSPDGQHAQPNAARPDGGSSPLRGLFLLVLGGVVLYAIFSPTKPAPQPALAPTQQTVAPVVPAAPPKHVVKKKQPAKLHVHPPAQKAQNMDESAKVKQDSEQGTDTK